MKLSERVCSLLVVSENGAHARVVVAECLFGVVACSYGGAIVFALCGP